MIDPQDLEEAYRLIAIYNHHVAQAEESYSQAYSMKPQLEALGIPYSEDSSLCPSPIRSLEVRLEDS